MKGFADFDLKEDFTYVSVSQNVDVLLYLGLGTRDQMHLYREVLKNPNIAATSAQHRPYLLRMFKIFRDMIFNNSSIYNRVKWDLVHSGDKVAKWSSSRPTIQEDLSDGSIDLLLRLGLDDIQYAVVNRRIIKSPDSALGDAFLRKKFLDLFVKFRNLIVLDQYIFTRAKDWLQERPNLRVG